MSDKLQRAITTIRAGNTAIGRELLTELLKENPQHEDAWMWMTAVVQTQERRLYCLERVLKINPNNETARRAASRLRQEQGQEDKKAQAELHAPQERRKEAGTPPAPPRRLDSRLVVAGVVAICIIGLIVLGTTLIPRLAAPPASPTATLAGQEAIPIAAPTPQLIADDEGGRPESGPVKWVFHAEGPVWSAPIVDSGVVYLGNYKDGAVTTEFFAVDAETALEKWRLETEGPWASPIAVVDGIAYVGDYRYLYALDSESGQELWRYGDLESPRTVTIADGVIYFNVGGDSSGLYAIDAQTGQEIWSLDVSGTADSAPIVVDGVVYFKTGSNIVYAINSQTGGEKWSYRQSYGANRSLIVSSGMVYLGDEDSVLYALDGQNGHRKWEFKAQDELREAAVAWNNNICFADMSGTLYTVNGQAGQEMWRHEAPEDTARQIMTLTHVDGTLLVGTSNGLWAFEGDTGEEIWKKSVGGILEPPVVADEIIYLTSGSNLYVLDMQSGQELGKLRTDSLWSLSPLVVDNGMAYFGSLDGDLYAVDTNALIAAAGQEDSAAGTADQPKEATFRANPQRTGFYDTKGVRELGDLKWSLQTQMLILASPAVADGMVHFGSFALDLDNGEMAWATRTEPPDYFDDILAMSSPAVFSGTVYYGDTNGLLYAVDSLTGETKWTFETPDTIISSPVVCEGAVYFAGGALYSLDAQTGEEIWRLETGGTTNVACENGTVYFGTTGGLYALDAQTAEEKWRYAGSGYPAIANGTIYLVVGPTGLAWFAAEDEPDTHMVAIDAATGQEKWKVQIDAVTLPAVAEGKVYFGTSDGALCALDSSSGAKEWCFATSDVILSSPSVAEGAVYFGTGFWATSDIGYLYAVDGQTGQELWRFSAGPILTSPAINDGVVYFNDSMGHFYALQNKSLSVATGDSHSDGTMARANLQRTGAYDVEAVRELRGIKWQFEMGGTPGAPPTVVGETVYLCGGTYVYALDTETGGRLWRYVTSGAFSSPAIADGVVYFGGYGGYVYAVDAKTGLKKWRVTTRGFPSEDMMASSPAVYNGTVYIGSYDGHMYALDAVTGQERWAFRTDGLIFSSPAIDAGILYFGSGDGFLYAVNSQTGQEEWRFQTMGGQIGATPAIADGTVYFRATDGLAYAVDSQSGSLKWSFPVRDKLISSPAVANGLVYYGTENGLYALDSQNGQELWFFETDTRVESSPVIANGLVYFGGDGGHLFAADARTGQSKWYFQTGGRANPTPVVADDVIFAFGDGYLYALSEDVPAGATPFPPLVTRPIPTITPPPTPPPVITVIIEKSTSRPTGTEVVLQTELPPTPTE